MFELFFDFHICQYNDLQGTVTGLKPGRCYEFEIVAISQEGESRPTKITDPVTTSESSSRPSPPLNVEVVEARNTSILLKWSQPLSDGNSPIIFYLIEKRDNAGSWSKAVQCSVQDLGVKVQFPHFFFALFKRELKLLELLHLSILVFVRSQLSQFFVLFLLFCFYLTTFFQCNK